MPAIVKLQLSLETLIEAITSLDLQEKCRLREVIEQQIFELEEELYQEEPETIAQGLEKLLSFSPHVLNDSEVGDQLTQKNEEPFNSRDV